MAYLSKYYIFPIVIVFVLNQFCEHWFFSDALHFANFLSLKLKENNELMPSFQSLMEDESNLVNELVLLASNIK
jgi:hypothetical protein